MTSWSRASINCQTIRSRCHGDSPRTIGRQCLSAAHAGELRRLLLPSRHRSATRRSALFRKIDGRAPAADKDQIHQIIHGHSRRNQRDERSQQQRPAVLAHHLAAQQQDVARQFPIAARFAAAAGRIRREARRKTRPCSAPRELPYTSCPPKPARARRSRQPAFCTGARQTPPRAGWPRAASGRCAPPRPGKYPENHSKSSASRRPVREEKT